MAVVRKLVLSNAFIKAYKKFSGKDKSLQSSIDNAMLKLEQDVYDPVLRTHKLGGKLAAYLACSCGYDSGSSSPLKNIGIKPSIFY